MREKPQRQAVSLTLLALAPWIGLEPVHWAHQGSPCILPWPGGPWQLWSESPAGRSQPPAHPGPCSEDKPELILSGKVRLLSQAGWIQGDETNAFRQPGSRALSVKHAGHLSGSALPGKIMQAPSILSWEGWHPGLRLKKGDGGSRCLQVEGPWGRGATSRPLWRSPDTRWRLIRHLTVRWLQHKPQPGFGRRAEDYALTHPALWGLSFASCRGSQPPHFLHRLADMAVDSRHTRWSKQEWNPQASEPLPRVSLQRPFHKAEPLTSSQPVSFPVSGHFFTTVFPRLPLINARTRNFTKVMKSH